MKKTYILLLLFSVTAITTKYAFRAATARIAATGPILYGIQSGGQLYKIDVMNCTACPIANLNLNGGASDVLVLPNGDILVHSDGLQRFTLPNSSPIWTGAVGEGYDGSILAPNGTIYLSRISPSNGLSIFDPLTNNITFIGNWPAGMVITEFFYQNGVLYGFGGLSGVQVVVQINTTTPSLSTVLNSIPPIVGGGTTNDGYTTAFGNGGSGLQLDQYNVATNSFTFVCDLAPFSTFSITGLSDLPPGVPVAPCLCTTFAGTVNNQGFNICVPGTVTIPYNNNAVLGSGDILRYILFSNTNDTLGSIIVQSSSPLIAFNSATMQTGVQYYLATIAGDNLNGNVDLNDPCLDISNAAQVLWRPLPTVTFSAANPNVCAGACTTVTASFTGTAPFALTYTTPASGTVIQTFSGNTGTFQVCTLPGSAPGSWVVQATKVVDAWCTCQ